jgi:excisionase family DNA binding protein
MLERDHYTPNEAATLLGMDDDVIHQAVHRGTLKAKKVGQDIVSIDRGDLVEWLENR